MNEENVNEVLPQPINPSKEIHIKYYPALLFRSVMARIVDAIFLALTFIGVFLLTRAIVMSTPNYINNDNQIKNCKLNSCLYEYKGDQLLSVTDIYIDTTKFNAQAQKETLKAHLEGGKGANQNYEIVDYIGFFSYMKNNAKVIEDRYQEILKNYDEFRLNLTTENNIHYFIKNGDKVELNEEFIKLDKANTYLATNCYGEYLKNYATSFLTVDDSNYYNSSKYISNILMYVEIPVSLIVSPLLIYLLPMLIFKRNRNTFGQALYHIGVIDSKCLSVKIRRTLIKYLIIFVGEICLSIVSFGAPLIISISMKIFSKKKQGFSDYMLGLFEVNISNSKIYHDLDEVALEEVKTNKEPVNFKVRNFD